MPFAPEDWNTGTDEDRHIVYDNQLRFVCDCGRDDGDADLEGRTAHFVAAMPRMYRAVLAYLNTLRRAPGAIQRLEIGSPGMQAEVDQWQQALKELKDAAAAAQMPENKGT